MSLDTLLIANRGEIACRIIKTARDMGIHCIAVFTEADSGAPFVQLADEAVRIDTSYLDGDAILEAARLTKSNAIHPGYGFLSENAAFATKTIESGIAWVGPNPDAIALMGDKISAKQLAEEADVPTLKSGENRKQAREIGFPILVKAAAGGGGKGMRIVESEVELSDAIEAAKREALGGFGDERVFLERYVRRARHIEIQIVGDKFGNIVHLGERECSIQRRHQKIIEEAPSPRVSEEMRKTMGEAALALAHALGYSSAGTVEFLLDDETGEFFFLEVNTRLQVEHPVTEMVTGKDLVREQLRVAAGEPLSFTQEEVVANGAAIEARLYAEDPANEFLPAVGTLAAFSPAAEPKVRWDSGVAEGSVIGTDFDPMLAKVISYAPTRKEAAGRLAQALARSHIGGVITNRDFLVTTLRSTEFLDGDTTTDFIDRVKPPRSLQLSDTEVMHAAYTAALWIQGENRAKAKALEFAPSGWRNGRLPGQSITFLYGDREISVNYRSERSGRFRFDNDTLAEIHEWGPNRIDVEVASRRQDVYVTRAGDELIVQTASGDITLTESPRFILPGEETVDGGFTAPMPGNVIDLRVAAGDKVSTGDTLIVLEAMKMEHAMRATEDGTVTDVRVAVGEQVESGAVLLVVESN